MPTSRTPVPREAGIVILLLLPALVLFLILLAKDVAHGARDAQPTETAHRP